MTAVGTLKNVKKGFDRPVDRSVELGFGFCFQQKRLWGVGSWLKDAGRRLQRTAGIVEVAVSPRDQETKRSTAESAEENLETYNLE